jgi:gas vesicle protein
MSDSKGDFLAGVIIGALVGFGTGLLTAPASGEETRARLRERSHELTEEARDRGEQLVHQARESAEELRAKARENARAMLARLRERVATTGDVEQALSEAEAELEGTHP